MNNNNIYIMYYILPFIGFIITLVAQWYVSSNYKKYKKVKTNTNMTGFEVARKILDKNGLHDVHIVETKGTLTDHYDPRRKVIRLSTDVFNGTTIAANSVAAHECGHAIQDKDNYSFMKFRSFLVPFVNFSSKLGYVVLFIGIIFSLFDLAVIGLILLMGMLIFQLVTLPVEFDASKRAKKELDGLNILNNKEQEQSKIMLTSAALTYVASLITTLLEILRLALIVFGNNRD